MPGLPHYTNSKASTKWYEPYHANLFEVNILPPPTVSGGSILLEHVTKIAGLNQDKGGAPVEQKYKFATRSYAAPIPESTTVDLTISFTLNLNDANELYVYKTLRDWWRIAFNPLTGEQGLKKDYRGTIVVTNYNRKGDIFWQRTFNDCIPSGTLPELAGDYAATDAQTMDVVWRSHWYQENIV
jgi:hypothetical protein